MKQTPFIILLILTSFNILISCQDESEKKISGAIYSKNYIQQYLHVEGTLTEWYKESSNIVFKIDCNSVSSKEEFRKLAQYYKDDEYNSWVIGPTAAIDDSIQRIQIVTLSDLNTEHPKGSDVSEWGTFSYLSFYSYIQNGYSLNQDVSKIDPTVRSMMGNLGAGLNGTQIYSMPLTAINQSNTKLMLNGAVLTLKPQSEVKGKHTFKLIIQFSKVKIEKEFEYDFGQ